MTTDRSPSEVIAALEVALRYVQSQLDRVAVTVDGRLDLLRDRRDANENFSAVCTPASIRTLLDAHASALRDAERLRKALSDLLDDTQHSEHFCGDPECPVDFARAALDDNTNGSDSARAAMGANTKGAA